MKKKISITIDAVLVDRVDNELKTSRRFSSRSHAIEFMISEWLRKEISQ